MIYLDTGCLVKLYYPEPESARVAALVSEKPIAFIPLHELEFLNALELKLYRKEATAAQVRATMTLLDQDIQSGVLRRRTMNWDDVFQGAAATARLYTRRFGCRSLDILHCAAAQNLAAQSFLTTDARQRRLARSLGLSCPTV